MREFQSVAIDVRRAAVLAAALAIPPACSEPEARSSSALHAARIAAPVDGVAAGRGEAGARFVTAIGGLQGPESVRYDAEQDVFFISNMTGYGSARDGNGYINRVEAGDPSKAVVFVRGGAQGVSLDAPKGMTIQGDTLWVADIEVLRAFDRRTGAPLGSIDFAPLGAVLLNDVATAPDGSLRVTDTGILMIPEGVKHVGPDRIFRVDSGHVVSVVAAGPELRQPNGIAWDALGERWVVASFDPFVGELAVIAGDDSSRRVIRRGPGRLDGVEVLGDGSMLFTSWVDSSLHLLDSRGERALVRGIPDPADIGIDTRRSRVAIPLAALGQVQLWSFADAVKPGS